MVLTPVLPEATVLENVDELEVFAGSHAQSELFDTGEDHAGPPNQNGTSDALVDDLLGRLQHPALFAFGIHETLPGAGGEVEYRFHDEPGAVHELGQALPVGIEVLDGPGRRPASHRRIRHCGGELLQQTRIEGLGYELFRSEGEELTSVGTRDFGGGFGLGEFRQRAYAGELHVFVDFGRSHIQGASKDEGKAEHVVDLIRIVGSARRNQRVGTNSEHFLGEDFRNGIRQRENEGPFGHAPDQIRTQYTGSGQSKEDVGTIDHVPRTRASVSRA